MRAFPPLRGRHAPLGHALVQTSRTGEQAGLQRAGNGANHTGTEGYNRGSLRGREIKAVGDAGLLMMNVFGRFRRRPRLSLVYTSPSPVVA